VDLKATLSPYVKQVDEALLTSLGDITPSSLRDACAHYPAAGGKRLRPVVALLACEAAGGHRVQAVPVAVALELVHNFSLVHDDIMDRDDTRRGIPTVHKKWSEATAILAGDTLLAKAFELLADSNIPPETQQRIVLDLATMTRVLCEGQELDMAFETRDATEPEYLDMIYRKTARIFEVAARCGAIVGLKQRGLGDNTAVKALEQYGKHLGLAFQIRDDVIDLLSTSAEMGKPQGSDVRKGKKTLIHLHAKAHATPDELATLNAIHGRANASNDDVAVVINIYRRTGGIARAEALVGEHTKGALDCLTQLPATPARESLRALAEFAAGRRA